MNAPAVLLALAGACLACLVAFELRPQSGSPDLPTASTPLAAAPPAQPAALGTMNAPLADTLLARPLFSQTRRAPGRAGSALSTPPATTVLPRMTAILIDGPRRSAIFAARDGKPMVVVEGGRIGPFTIQTIEPQQVTVMGPDGKRIVRTSFDPDLRPPPSPPPPGLGAPQFPGIVSPGAPPAPLLPIPPMAPGAGFGAAR